MIPDNINNLPEQMVRLNQMPERRAFEVSKDELKTSRLTVETFQNFFKALGFTQLGNFFSQCRLGVLWVYHREGLVKGDLQKTLEKDIHEITHSPYEFSRFLNACRDTAELISIPLGVALRNEVFSGILKPILENEYKNLLDKSFFLKIPEKNALLQSVFQKEVMPGSTANDAHKLMAEKATAAFEMGTILSIKYQFQELSLFLALASSLAKAYMLYLEKTDTPPTELFNILKFQSEVTLRKHLNTVDLALQEGDVYQEIRDEIVDHLRLLSLADNDGIYFDLLNYRNVMHQLFSIYLFELKNFDREMDQLLDTCKPLIAHRENLELTAQNLLQDHVQFLNEQSEKLLNVLDDYRIKLNAKDFERYIQPEFEMALGVLNKHFQNNQESLESIASFTILSMDEQKIVFDEIVKKNNAETKQTITALVKNVCREV
jgi:hypothetical protein